VISRGRIAKLLTLVTGHWSPITLCCVMLLAGCAVTPQQPVASGPEAQCREVFRRVDDAIAAAGVADGMAARVAGFPYLRVDRFLASYAREEMSEAQFTEWMGRLSELGRQAHAVEVSNLPVEAAEALGHALWDIGREHMWIAPALADCATRLAAADLADSERRAALRAAATVPDDYATWNRVAGLYWLTRIPFAGGVRRWHEEVRRTYAVAPEALPVTGALTTYLPPPAGRADVAALLARASVSPLGVPDPRGADLELLFRLFAPAFIVDTAGDADRPGELGWNSEAVPQVISHRPVVYRRLSHARYQGRVLLQLNYSIWFPERPKAPGWDLLGGHLDGVLWRVTLTPDGEPWLYDSMHLCGCYHLFYPTARAALRPQPDTLDETAFVPQALARVAPGTRLALRLAAGTHYVERVLPDAAPTGPALEYSFADDDLLRSVVLPDGGRRSVFRPDGIVPGTERGERWLFWPMGVPEPGAQRQWGRHATAFVGRRHFDDPGLLERYFTLQEP
jgi:hypothetical protein